jgi:hypothetical protein
MYLKNPRAALLWQWKMRGGTKTVELVICAQKMTGGNEAGKRPGLEALLWLELG